MENEKEYYQDIWNIIETNNDEAEELQVEYEDIYEEKAKKDILVLDLETDSLEVTTANLKFFGAYSYAQDDYFLLDYKEKDKIRELIKTHEIIVTFNGKVFDWPILLRFLDYNNESSDIKYKIMIDMFEVCAPKPKAEFGKNKLKQMFPKIDIKKYSLRDIMEYLKITEVRKGDIDYNIFKKDIWTEEELLEINTYLKHDIELTKALFEFFDKQYGPLKEMLPLKAQERFKHITSSSASLSYQIVCHKAGFPIVWNDDKDFERVKFEGGHHLMNKVPTAKGLLVSVDYSSAYPHSVIMGNLLSPMVGGWNGDGFFSIQGTYNNKELGKAETVLKELMDLRLKAKNEGDKIKANAYKICINCFSEDTQIMTIDGIKLLKECKVGDLVYSINPKTEQVEVKPIEKMYEQEYLGKMIHFNGKNKDLIVSPNHHMLFKGKGSMNNVQKIEAKNILGRAGHYPSFNPFKGLKDKFIDMKQFREKDDLHFIKLNNPYEDRRENRGLKYIRSTRLHYSINYNPILKGKWFFQRRKRDMLIPEFIKTEDLFYLIGIFLSEGNIRITKPKKYINGNVRGLTYDVCISQYKKINPQIYNKIKKCLDNIGIRYSYSDKRFLISSQFWYDFFSKLKNNSFDCSLPDWCWKYDSLLLKYLHQGLYDGDGNKNQYRYNTVSKKLKDDMIRLNLHLGYRCTTCFETMKNNNIIWRIFRTGDGSYRKYCGKYINNPTNKIICCSVKDNHTLLAGRNDKLIWTGQSFYGLVGNAVFKTLYNPTSAADCTHIVRTMLKKTAKTLDEHGFIPLYGFTDNIIVQIPEPLTKEDLMRCVNKYIEEIKSHFPFPKNSFKMDLERSMKFIWFVSKNCYLWVDDKDKVEYKATLLNINRPPVVRMLFDNYIAPKIVKELGINFTEEELLNKIKDMLKDNIEIAAEDYDVREASTYKSKTALHHQISEKYGAGRHKLIPNLKNVGVGRKPTTKKQIGVRYCNYEDFINNKLTVDDIDTTKIMKDFKRFILNPIIKENIKKRKQRIEKDKKGK